MWGSQLWLPPAFSRRTVCPVQSRLKGGFSQNWLPHKTSTQFMSNTSCSKKY
jgi:hypothetical protein